MCNIESSGVLDLWISWFESRMSCKAAVGNASVATDERLQPE